MKEMRLGWAVLILGAIGIVAGCSPPVAPPEPKVSAKMTVQSTSFKADQAIPEKYSAYGENVSPNLSWSGAPPKTQTFALIVDDPDAPRATPFVHWVAFDIPATTNAIEEGKPAPGKWGNNDNGDPAYFGPRPPSGTHHYHFKVYALDKVLGLTDGATKDDLIKAMDGHTLAAGELVATYSH